MVSFTLIYGMRLYHGPATDLSEVQPMTTTIEEDGREVRVTAHVIEGTSREQIRQQLLRSIDAFFELH